MEAKGGGDANEVAVYALGLRPRILRLIHRMYARDAGISEGEAAGRMTAADLMRYQEQDFLEYPGIGESALGEIVESLRRRGLTYPVPRDGAGTEDAVPDDAPSLPTDTPVPARGHALVTDFGLAAILPPEAPLPGGTLGALHRRLSQLQLLSRTELVERGFVITELPVQDRTWEVWLDPGAATTLEVEVVAIARRP